ncbi:hypothetical protein JXB37_05860 [candidate division WOR-3 bacterium]|nr:hypothetical protein [candidate division WOR-3 bacterium]
MRHIAQTACIAALVVVGVGHGWEKYWDCWGTFGTRPSQTRMLQILPYSAAPENQYTVHVAFDNSGIKYDYSTDDGETWLGEMEVPSGAGFGNWYPGLRVSPDDHAWLCKLNNYVAYEGFELAVQRRWPPQPGEPNWYFDTKHTGQLWPCAPATALSSGVDVAVSPPPGSEFDGQPMVYAVLTVQSDDPHEAQLLFVAVDTLYQLPYYQKVLATAPYGHDFQPSIDHTPGDLVHVAYRDDDGRIWYRTWVTFCTPDWLRQGTSPVWDAPRQVSGSMFEPASQPSIDADGEKVYCVWRGPNENSIDIGEVYRRARYLYEWPPRWREHLNISQSPGIESGSPQCHTGTTVIWQEQLGGPGGDFEVMVRWTPGTTFQLSGDPGFNCRWPHVAVVNPVPPNIIKFRTYALWTEVDHEYPENWRAHYRYYTFVPHFGGGDEYPSYLSAALGEQNASPYCLARDGYRVYPEASVDYARGSLQYSLPYLDPLRDYLAEFVVYNGEEEAVTEKFLIGGLNVGSLEVPVGSWDTLYLPIPKAARRTGKALVDVERASGLVTCLAGLRVFEYQSCNGDGQAGSTGSILGLLRAVPNPYHERCLLQLRGAGPASLVEVFDVNGRLVRTLPTAGGTASWDGRNEQGADLAPGVYCCRITGSPEGQCVKIVKR